MDEFIGVSFYLLPDHPYCFAVLDPREPACTGFTVVNR
jgi:hypothetical protein